jgi:hypothetical protein
MKVNEGARFFRKTPPCPSCLSPGEKIRSILPPADINLWRHAANSPERRVIYPLSLRTLAVYDGFSKWNCAAVGADNPVCPDWRMNLHSMRSQC